MKKVLITMLAVMFVIGVGIYTTADAGIQGSSHDFTDNISGLKGNDGTGAVATETGTDEWNSRRKEICRVCHIPHTHGRTNYLNALDMGIGTPTPNSLLWNRALSAAAFTLYDGTARTIADIPGSAKLCLSCHDGVTAVDDWPDNGNAGAAVEVIGSVGGQYSGGYNIGTDMRGTHPIGVTYAAEAGEFNADTVTWANGDAIADTLDGGTVVCATCHDVHSQEHVAGTHLLRQVTKASDALGTDASALCLTCHIK